MGDSLTEGYDIDLTQRWSDGLAKDLGIEVINNGISGDTTSGMLARFQQMIIAHQPTCVIIMGGTNDLWLKLSNEQIVSNMHAMTRQARYHHVIPIIGIPPPYYPTDFSHDSDSLFPTPQTYQQQIDAYRNYLKQYATEQAFPIIDFGIGLSPKLFLSDGLHPSEAGHEVMKNTAKTVLVEML